jgi:hypothetical protein
VALEATAFFSAGGGQPRDTGAGLDGMSSAMREWCAAASRRVMSEIGGHVGHLRGRRNACRCRWPDAQAEPPWTKTGRVRIAADLVICDERFRSGARASRR